VRFGSSDGLLLLLLLLLYKNYIVRFNYNDGLLYKKKGR